MSTIKSRGPPQNDRFQSIRSQLERETAELLAQRRSLEGTSDAKPQNRPGIRQVYTQSAALTPIVNRTEQESHKTQEVISRLQQIIRLCKEEGSLSNDEMREVVKVETEILNYLQRNSLDPEPKVVKPYSDTPQADKEKIPSNHTWGKPQTQSQEQLPLSQDTLEMIAEIERKALTEIIHLQKERDAIKAERDQLAAELTKPHIQGSKVGFGEVERLREENRLLREENNALNVRLSTLGPVNFHGHGQEYGNDYIKEGLSSGQYSSQIAVYENELKRATLMINELRARLVNVTGLEQLHEQGERIRRETAELLQYKSRNLGGDDYAVLRELQERLEEEEHGKAAFLEELKVFKQKYIQLEEENQQLRSKSRANYNPMGSSPQREANVSRGISKKRSGLGDYQSSINELRQAQR